MRQNVTLCIHCLSCFKLLLWTEMNIWFFVFHFQFVRFFFSRDSPSDFWNGAQSMVSKPKGASEVQEVLRAPVLMRICYSVWPPDHFQAKSKSFHTGSLLNQTVFWVNFRGFQNLTKRRRENPRLFAFQCARCSLSPIWVSRHLTCAPLHGRHTPTQLHTLMHRALHAQHQLCVTNTSSATAVYHRVAVTLRICFFYFVLVSVQRPVIGW